MLTKGQSLAKRPTKDGGALAETPPGPNSDPTLPPDAERNANCTQPAVAVFARRPSRNVSGSKPGARRAAGRPERNASHTQLAAALFAGLPNRNATGSEFGSRRSAGRPTRNAIHATRIQIWILLFRPLCVGMYVCMYVCMQVCMYVCMCVCLCVNVYVCLCVCVYVCVCIRVYVCACVYLCNACM